MLVKPRPLTRAAGSNTAPAVGSLPTGAAASKGYLGANTLAGATDGSPSRPQARNNWPIQGSAPTSTIATTPAGVALSDERPAELGLLEPSAKALRRRRAAGAIGVLGILGSAFLLAAGSAAQPGRYVPGRSGGWPGWMAGPYRGLGLRIGQVDFELLMLVMFSCYLLVLHVARALPLRTLLAAIVLAQLILLAGPPLISQDVFGYIAFARMGVLHGLDPYTMVPLQAVGDPILPFIGWPTLRSPYGPLFTLLSYPLAPLGLAGALWGFKLLALSASLGAVGLLASAAARMGRSPAYAAAFLGLNPVLLALALAGAHNDTLILLLLAAALILTAGASPRFRAGAAALATAVGVKVSAGLALPFLVLAPRSPRERVWTATIAALTLAALMLLAAVAFGSHALGFLGAVGEQQRMVAVHSVPAETARLVGLQGTPDWWRNLFVAAFALVLVFALWRTAQGADWRTAAGWTTLALLICTAWLLPWYAVWTLPLAALSDDRRLRAAALGFCGYALLIHVQLANPLLSPA
jgi:Glycosyltransferase family 87